MMERAGTHAKPASTSMRGRAAAAIVAGTAPAVSSGTNVRPAEMVSLLGEDSAIVRLATTATILSALVVSVMMISTV